VRGEEGREGKGKHRSHHLVRSSTVHDLMRQLHGGGGGDGGGGGGGGNK
jgi:hypothetical protein